MDRGKVVLQQFVISFLLQGTKEVNFAGSSARVNNTKALVIAQGNCLVTEKSQGSEDYKTILFFFSKQRLADFLLKKGFTASQNNRVIATPPYFIIEQDEFIKIFISSLQLHFTAFNNNLSKQLLEVKFEEIMVYLIGRHGNGFIAFLLNSLKPHPGLTFKNTIEANKYTNLGIGELAFLCNMSISTFKRHFAEEFNDTPGNWFKEKRLERAKNLLQAGGANPSEVFTGSGYKNLSHFSNAYKARFGKSPRRHLQD